MHRFMVNMKTARIFKGIPESWNPAKNAEKFAKMRWLKGGGVAVNQARVYHDAALTVLYLDLTPALISVRTFEAATAMTSRPGASG